MTKRNQRPTRKYPEANFGPIGPPSSAFPKNPIFRRRIMSSIPGNKSYENTLFKLRSRARDRNDEVKHGRELEAPGRNNEAHLWLPDLPVYRGHEPWEAETWVIVTLEAAARWGHGGLIVYQGTH